MITFTEKEVIISRETWEEYRKDDYFQELIEVLEDREAYKQAKAKTDHFIDLEEYHNKRMKLENV